MYNENISKIEINDSGELYVYLESGGKAMYQHIYREGREVYWDKKKKAFMVPPPRKWSYLDWFHHILEVAANANIMLAVTSETQWVNIPNEIIKQCSIVK